MADLHLSYNCTVCVTKSDLLLILKALGGRLKEDEKDRAKELGDQLSLTRAKAVHSMLQENEKLMSNLEMLGKKSLD